MAIAEKLQEVTKLLDHDEFEKANIKIDNILSENENPSFNILILKTEILLKLNKYDEFIKFANNAYSIAFQNSKRSQISKSLKFLASYFFKIKDYDNALKYIIQSCKFDDEPNSESKMLKGVIGLKYMKNKNIDEKKLGEIESKLLLETIKPVKDDIPVDGKTFLKSEPKSTDKLDNKTKQNMRFDWFDSGKKVELSIYIKNINSESVKYNITETSLNFTFTDSDSFDYEFKISKLFSNIKLNCEYKVFRTKLEIILFKDNEVSWTKLEKSESDDSDLVNFKQIPKDEAVPASYPSSSIKKVDWTNFKIDDDDQEENNEDPDQFFKKLYDGADENAKRAMMKSFLESNGTSLSTDWSDVGSREVKPYEETKDN